MRRTSIMAAVAMAAIFLVSAALGIGYAVSYSGSMTSTDNTNEVTLYGIDIYQGDSYTNATMLTQSLFLSNPYFRFDDSGVHNTVTPTETVTIMSGYKLHTDNDYDLGAHIRMWIKMNNPLIWIFIDRIELSIVTINGNVETFVCGISDDGTSVNSGVCTDLISLPIHKTEHPFEIAIYYKDSVQVDYIDQSELALMGAVAVFAYDDTDPILLGGDDDDH